MGKLLNVLLFAFLVQANGLFAQGKVNQNIKVNYLDSTLYYLQQCQTTKGIDSLTFYQAIGFLWQTDLNANSTDQIEKISNQFKRQNYIYFADEIDIAFILKITNSDSTDFAIRYCQNIIHKYDSDQNPEERFKALSALIEIRKPLRAKSIPGTFDFYASRLKVYLENNDSSGLSISYFCIGSTYRLAGLIDMAIYNLKKSISYINKTDTLTNLQISGLGGWMNNTSFLGQLYLETGDYEAAISCSQEAKYVKIKMMHNPNVSYLNGNIALARLHLNKLDSIYELLNSTIPMAMKDRDYPSLARIYEIKGQFFMALNQLDSEHVWKFSFTLI